jgi:hypothetical protein
MKRTKTLFCAGVFCMLACAVSAYSIAGIGFHYGLDYSLSMKNTELYAERVALSNLSLTTTDPGFPTLSGNNLPIFISRKDFTSTGLNLGGKIYIDIIPFIDAVEVSFNYGVWKYQGAINFPTGLVQAANLNLNNPADPANFTYMSLPLQADGKTPYSKLQFDLTARKYLVQIPPIIKIIKIYGGAGMTFNFATPMLSNKLIQDVMANAAQGSKDITSLASSLFTDAIAAQVVDKLKSGFSEKSVGMHIDAGILIKLPFIPLGLYTDAKFMIPFGKLDSEVDDLKGTGFLINLGLVFGI